jgi:peroxiredoxin
MPPSPGSRAPAGAALDPTGAEIALAGLAAAGPAVVVFYKADCPASEAAAHALPRLAVIPGLAVGAVSQDEPAETVAFAAAHGWSAPVRVLRDPEPWAISTGWDIAVTPTFVLLASGGAVAAVVEGWSRDDVNALAARAAALADAPPREVSGPGDGPAFRPG